MTSSQWRRASAIPCKGIDMDDFAGLAETYAERADAVILGAALFQS